MGDLVETTPLVLDLFRADRNAKIDVLAWTEFAPIVEGLPGVTLRTLPSRRVKDLNDEIETARSLGRRPEQALLAEAELALPSYDWVINVSHGLFSAWLSPRLDAKVREGGVLNDAGEWLYGGDWLTFLVALAGIRRYAESRHSGRGWRVLLFRWRGEQGLPRHGEWNARGDCGNGNGRIERRRWAGRLRHGEQPAGFGAGQRPQSVHRRLLPDSQSKPGGRDHHGGRPRTLRIQRRWRSCDGGPHLSRRDGGPATSALLASPIDVAADQAGNLFILEATNHRVRKVTADGVIGTVVGTGTAGFNGDGRSAVFAQINFASGLAVDGSGNLFIADSANRRIRRVTPDGVIGAVAGTGAAGFSGDDGLAQAAQLDAPLDVVVDEAGNLFIADYGNYRIRKVTVDGVIKTAAGFTGYGGDDGPASSAQIDSPLGLAVDGSGTLFIADSNNSRIRRVTADGIITTAAAGGGTLFASPAAVAVDVEGNLFIAAIFTQSGEALSLALR